ncbi:MAG TPA: TlpA disulfide reductase family protein [Pyrinomonadaceae bacterium]|jgi:thiol-disulfide isomerase/thioredoxin
MGRLFIFIALWLALAPAALRAQAGHEYAPLQEKTVNYKDWTFKSLKDGAPVSLRSLVEGKRLVMVVYFAPWCPNWRNEAPVAASLYEKYKAHGLEIVGVSEYATVADVRAFFGESGAPYPVVTESEAREDRDKTTHYAYRQLTGDTRRWGSPWNIFLEPSKLQKKSDVLTETAWVVNGELIEADVEKFIRERLGLDTKAQLRALAQDQAIVPCKQQ